MKNPSEILRILEAPLSDLSIGLTPRERHVARLAARGYKISEIGEYLGINDKTVEGHLASIKDKTGLSKAEITQHLTERIERSVR